MLPGKSPPATLPSMMPATHPPLTAAAASLSVCPWARPRPRLKCPTPYTRKPNGSRRVARYMVGKLTEREGDGGRVRVRGCGLVWLWRVRSTECTLHATVARKAVKANRPPHARGIGASLTKPATLITGMHTPKSVSAAISRVTESNPLAKGQSTAAVRIPRPDTTKAQ